MSFDFTAIAAQVAVCQQAVAASTWLELADFSDTEKDLLRKEANHFLNLLAPLLQAQQQGSLSETRTVFGLQMLLAARWQWVRKSDANYFQFPSSPINEFCVSLAKKLGVELEKPWFKLLVPSLDETDVFVDLVNPFELGDGELTTTELLISDGERWFIPILDFIDMLAVDTEVVQNIRPKHLTVNSYTHAMTDDELDRLQRVSPASSVFQQKVGMNRQLRAGGADLESALIQLRVGLCAGGEQDAAVLHKASYEGSAEIAGQRAAEAIYEFYEVWTKRLTQTQRDLVKDLYEHPSEQPSAHNASLESVLLRLFHGHSSCQLSAEQVARVAREQLFDCVEERSKSIAFIVQGAPRGLLRSIEIPRAETVQPLIDLTPYIAAAKHSVVERKFSRGYGFGSLQQALLQVQDVPTADDKIEVELLLYAQAAGLSAEAIWPDPAARVSNVLTIYNQASATQRLRGAELFIHEMADIKVLDDLYEICVREPENIAHALPLLNTIIKDQEYHLFNKILHADKENLPSIVKMAESNPEGYTRLLKQLLADEQFDLCLRLVCAANEEGTDALYFVAYLFSQRYAELLTAVQHAKTKMPEATWMAFNRALWQAKDVNGETAALWLVLNEPEQFYVSILHLMQAQQYELILEIVQIQYENTHILYWFANYDFDGWSEMLLGFLLQNQHELFNQALKAESRDHELATTLIAKYIPVQFNNLVAQMILSGKLAELETVLFSKDIFNITAISYLGADDYAKLVINLLPNAGMLQRGLMAVDDEGRSQLVKLLKFDEHVFSDVINQLVSANHHELVLDALFLEGANTKKIYEVLFADNYEFASWCFTLAAEQPKFYVKLCAHFLRTLGGRDFAKAVVLAEISDKGRALSAINQAADYFAVFTMLAENDAFTLLHEVLGLDTCSPMNIAMRAMHAPAAYVDFLLQLARFDDFDHPVLSEMIALNATEDENIICMLARQAPQEYARFVQGLLVNKDKDSLFKILFAQDKYGSALSRYAQQEPIAFMSFAHALLDHNYRTYLEYIYKLIEHEYFAELTEVFSLRDIHGDNVNLIMSSTEVNSIGAQLINANQYELFEKFLYLSNQEGYTVLDKLYADARGLELPSVIRHFRDVAPAHYEDMLMRGLLREPVALTVQRPSDEYRRAPLSPVHCAVAEPEPRTPPQRPLAWEPGSAGSMQSISLISPQRTQGSKVVTPPVSPTRSVASSRSMRSTVTPPVSPPRQSVHSGSPTRSCGLFDGSPTHSSKGSPSRYSQYSGERSRVPLSEIGNQLSFFPASDWGETDDIRADLVPPRPLPVASGAEQRLTTGLEPFPTLDELPNRDVTYGR